MRAPFEPDNPGVGIVFQGVGVNGGVPERLKGADCKSVGYAYVGSNPTPSTTPQRSAIGTSDRLLYIRCVNSCGVLMAKPTMTPDFAGVAQW